MSRSSANTLLFEYLSDAATTHLFISQNEADSGFLRGRPNVKYIYDSNILIYYLNPSENLHYGNLFRFSRGRHATPQRSIATAVITGSFLFSGELAGQKFGDPPSCSLPYVLPQHLYEFINVLNDQMEIVQNEQVLDEFYELYTQPENKLEKALDNLNDVLDGLEAANQPITPQTTERIADALGDVLLVTRSSPSARAASMIIDAAAFLGSDDGNRRWRRAEGEIWYQAAAESDNWTVRRVRAILTRLRRETHRPPQTNNDERDALALIQIANMNGNAEPDEGPFLFVTANELMDLAWEEMKKDRRLSEVLPVLKGDTNPIRMLGQYTPLLNLADMPNHKYDTEPFDRLRNVIEDFLSVFAHSASSTSEDSSLSESWVRQLAGAHNPSKIEGFELLSSSDHVAKEKIIRSREAYQHAELAAIPVNHQVLVERATIAKDRLGRFYEAFKTAEGRLEGVSVLFWNAIESAVHEYSLAELQIVSTESLIDDLTVMRPRQQAGMRHLDLVRSLPTVSGDESALEAFIAAIERNDPSVHRRRTQLIAQIASEDRPGARHLVLARIAAAAESWGFALASAQSAVRSWREDKPWSDLAYREAVYFECLCRRQLSREPSEDQYRRISALLTEAVEGCHEVADTFGAIRLRAEAVALDLRRHFLNVWKCQIAKKSFTVELGPVLEAARMVADEALDLLVDECPGTSPSQMSKLQLQTLSNVVATRLIEVWFMSCSHSEKLLLDRYIGEFLERESEGESGWPWVAKFNLRLCKYLLGRISRESFLDDLRTLRGRSTLLAHERWMIDVTLKRIA